MKKNAQQLALLLYPTQQSSQWPFLTIGQVEFVLGTMTDSGRASLLYYLKGKKLLRSQKINEIEQWQLTVPGKKAIEDQFPALSTSYEVIAEEWSCIVFLKPPKGDPQFRYLRRLILQTHGFGLSRGVYCVPSSMVSRIKNELSQLYTDSILLFTVAEWLMGNPREYVLQEYGLVDLSATYSGISKEIDELLEIGQQSGSWNQQQKKHFLMVFHRLWDVLGEDSGLAHVYVPNTVPVTIILSRLQIGMANYL